MWQEKHAAYGKRSTQPRAWTLHGYQSTSSAVLEVKHKVMKCESAAGICCGAFLQPSVAVLRLLEHICECMLESNSRLHDTSYVDATPSMSWNHCQGMQAASALRSASRRAQGPWPERTVRPFCLKRLDLSFHHGLQPKLQQYR